MQVAAPYTSTESAHSFRIIVSGGRSFGRVPDDAPPAWRHFYERRALYEQQLLGHVLDALRPTLIVHGAARGADALAELWAQARGVETRPCPVTREQWFTLGRAAGLMRNTFMLVRYGPDAVIAFPGGNGTAHMMSETRRARVPLYRVDQHGVTHVER